MILRGLDIYAEPYHGAPGGGVTSSLPVEDDEFREHLKIDDAGVEVRVRAIYLPAAVGAVQTALGRQLVTSTRTLTLARLPVDGIELPFPPVQSITSVKYYDSANVQQTLASSVYAAVPLYPPATARAPICAPQTILCPKSGQAWPATYPRLDAVEITYVCGYGDSAVAVPDEFRAAVLLAAHDLHEVRGPLVVGTATPTKAVERLLRPYKVRA